MVLAVMAVLLAPTLGCVQQSRTARSDGSSLNAVASGSVAEISAQPLGNGRFRAVSEAGVVGYGVVETVVTGAFDEEAEAFEASIDLERLMASAPPGVLASQPPVDGELVIRGVAGLVFVKADERGWILLPGSIDEILESAGLVRPDAMLNLLDSASDGVVEVPGEWIDGEITTRYSGWLPAGALDGLGGVGALSSVGADPLSGLGGVVTPSELFDRMIRFDVWVDREGQARRLVIEADLESLAEVARRVDGTDQGIDQLRLRYEVDWYDLGTVTIEPPPRSEVSVIDRTALHEPAFE